MAAVGKENETARTSLELLYTVSRELTSALDLRTVLQRVIDRCIQTVGAINGSILVLDKNGQILESAIVIEGKIHDHSTQQLSATLDKGLAGWVARERQAVLVPDTSQDERWLRRPYDNGSRTGAKSVVSAPLLTRDQLVGVITLVHPETGFFTQDHLTLLQAIADQAAIAVLNARLYEESQSRAHSMTAVAESAAVITASLKVEDVLQRILEQISRALQVEVVSLALIDATGRNLDFCASSGGAASGILGKRLGISQGLAGWVVRHDQGVVVRDVYQDPRFSPRFDRETGFRTRAIVCAPIRSQGQVIGVLEAINPLSGAFGPDALLVLTGIGSLAGTAIRHAQLFEQLQSAHLRYHDLFEDSIDPILVTDWEGHILEANRQAETTTGLGRENLQEMEIKRLNLVNTRHLGQHFEALSSGETVSYEAALKIEDSRQIPVQVYVRKVDIDGVTHLQWILRDITERKKLDDLRDDLTSMIYHDLRSPLANIVSSLDVLASVLNVEDEPSLQSLLNIALRSTERIQRLTNSLLDINRLEAGQEVGKFQPVAPEALVKDALEAVSPIAFHKGVDISAQINQTLPDVWVDADMIRRVLINLVENAIKFTPQDSKITIDACQEGDAVEMWVQDNGPGIPAAYHDRIFDKFSRLHSKDGPRGLGLGLAYCRLAVQGHGGRIWVESKAGSGAAFHFTLPLAREKLAAHRESP